MSSAEPERCHPFPRCARCNAVIGVYEPLVKVADDRAYRTSQAAEPNIAADDGFLYHGHCYDSISASEP
jgi:hypothetical protein